MARWVVQLEYYGRKATARNALARTPACRRAGLVDRETGETWSSKSNYPAVRGALKKEGTAPERFERKSNLGPIKPRRRKRRRSDRER